MGHPLHNPELCILIQTAAVSSLAYYLHAADAKSVE